ncbi:MAG TPA: alpha/beta hydrolase, partial [Vicinamibacterales bacterium]
PDWQPLELKIEGNTRSSVIGLSTSFTLTTAINEVSQNNTTASKEDQISPGAIVLPNNAFAGYEALAARLSQAKAGGELPVYVAPQAEIKLKVNGITNALLTGPSGSLHTRRYDVTFENQSKPADGTVTIDDHLRLVRFELPSAGLLVVRDDAASVSMRSELARNPSDTNVSIPANGFQLAATLTPPPDVEGRLKYPAVILVDGTSGRDRDNVIDGTPVFAELAGALAASGHVVLRYDPRGVGQSGGRIEGVTLADYADDLSAAVKWIARQTDVDHHRIIVCGEGPDGAAVALIAASHDGAIEAVVSIDGSGANGRDLMLERQQRVLAGMTLSDAERQSRVAMQRTIDDAVLTGHGWEGVADRVRKQADTPMFKSQLEFDPAVVLPRVRQPLLIIAADEDAEIPPAYANRLADLAKHRKRVPAAEVVHLPGVTQALVAAPDTTVNPKVAAAIADWIKKQ